MSAANKGLLKMNTAILAALVLAANDLPCVTSTSYRDEYNVPGQQDELAPDPVSLEYVGYQGHQVLYINFAAFSNPEKRDPAYQIVVDNFKPFDITVTNQQPASQPYSQIDVRDCDCTANGLANKDCGNSTLSNTGWVESRPSLDREPNATELGDLISHEAGHNFGLVHVDDSGQSPGIMRPG